MGRDLQMKNWDMENSFADASGKDIRSMNKKRNSLLVTFLALLLPFLITSCYFYYSLTPHASPEAMVSFQGRPFSKFIIPKGLSPEEDTDNSIFENDTTGSDIQMDPKIEDTENTTDNLGATSVELGNTEAMAEDVEAGVSSGVMAENQDGEYKLNPSETAKSVNETRSSENSTLLDVNATMLENDVLKQKVSDDSSNNTEDTIDSLGKKPEEGNTKADAMAENEEGKKVNSISPDVNANTVESDTWKQSKVPDESPDNHQQSEPIAIAMESHKQGVCDLLKGSWVPDSRPPLYTNGSCRYISEHQNCIRNGRPDIGYLHWKWQPEQCELPRIDAAAFLNAMRDRSMYFVGDSLARNQFQSLLCLLSRAELPNRTYQRADDKDNVYVFRSHNFTLAIFWSTHLVHAEEKLITWPDNSTQDVVHIHLDKLDKAWVERLPGIDFLQVSTGQWWFKRSLFHLGGQPIGCHSWDADGHVFDEWKECTKIIGFADSYRMTIHNVLRESLSISGYTGTTILRTFSPDHFEDGQWHNGGKCVRTSPGGLPMSDLTKFMYDIQIQEFQNVTAALSASEKKRIRLLDITNLAHMRADGHPDAYRTFQPFSKESKQPVQRDCLHWCLPGPIDTWNELLVETLRP